jgi:NAD(P)-dependent dehydrogenase (short-subunit alcohol dehydrogenase family)
MLDYDPDLWDRVMTVNVKGTWLVTRAAVPLLREGAGSSTSLRYRAVGRRADGLRRQ